MILNGYPCRYSYGEVLTLPIREEISIVTFHHRQFVSIHSTVLKVAYCASGSRPNFFSKSKLCSFLKTMLLYYSVHVKNKTKQKQKKAAKLVQNPKLVYVIEPLRVLNMELICASAVF